MNLVVFDIGGTSVKYGLYQDGSIEKKVLLLRQKLGMK